MLHLEVRSRLPPPEQLAKSVELREVASRAYTCVCRLESLYDEAVRKYTKITPINVNVRIMLQEEKRINISARVYESEIVIDLALPPTPRATSLAVPATALYALNIVPGLLQLLGEVYIIYSSETLHKMLMKALGDKLPPRALSALPIVQRLVMDLSNVVTMDVLDECTLVTTVEDVPLDEIVSLARVDMRDIVDHLTTVVGYALSFLSEPCDTLTPQLDWKCALGFDIARELVRDIGYSRAVLYTLHNIEDTLTLVLARLYAGAYDRSLYDKVVNVEEKLSSVESLIMVWS